MCLCLPAVYAVDEVAPRPWKAIDANGGRPLHPEGWLGDPALAPGAVEHVRALDGQAQLAMVIRSYSSFKILKRFIDWSAEQGINCIAFDLRWKQIEPVEGQFDFSFYDPIINYIVNKGMYVQIKPGWEWESYPDWISPSLESEPVKPAYGINRHELTFANPELNQRIARFCGAVARHYRGYPVTCYTPIGMRNWELEYSFADYRDVSPAACAQFREWLQHRYASLNALNQAWGTAHQDWATIEPPTDLAPRPNGQPDLRQGVLDWFCYREWSIKQLINAIAGEMHQADPKAVVAVQVGRHIDCPFGPRRGSIGLAYWGQAADMYIGDPSPKDGDVMGYVIDHIRTAGKQAGMELDTPAHLELPIEQYTAHSVECWRHGGLWSSWANWAPAELAKPENMTMTKNTVAAIGPVPKIAPPQTALFVSKWDLYCYHEQNRWKEYREAYADLTSGGKQIIDVLTDDIIFQDPARLGKYEKIVVPYGDCLDRRVKELLNGHKSKLELARPDAYGRNLLDVRCEP